MLDQLLMFTLFQTRRQHQLDFGIIGAASGCAEYARPWLGPAARITVGPPLLDRMTKRCGRMAGRDLCLS